MNNVRNLSGAAVATAVLVVIVVVFLWQSKALQTMGTFDPITADLDPAIEAASESDAAAEIEPVPESNEVLGTDHISHNLRDVKTLPKKDVPNPGPDRF